MKLRLTLTGDTPLIVQADTLVDPFNEAKMEIDRITSKKTKQTEEDRKSVAKLEFQASLYYDETIGPYMPGRNIEACLRDAARRTKKGKDVEVGVIVLSEMCPLVYKGSRDKDKLYEDKNFVDRRSVCLKGNSGKVRTMRTRPIFHTWACEAEIDLDTFVLDLAKFKEFAETAGSKIGIGTYRPRHGRFKAEVEKL